MPQDFQTALPELTLAAGAMALLMLGVFTRKSRDELILWLAVLLLAIAGWILGRWPAARAAVAQ